MIQGIIRETGMPTLELKVIGKDNRELIVEGILAQVLTVFSPYPSR